MHLYIMRHGETFWNKKGLIQGSSDIELTPYGEELARDTRDGFDKDEIHISAHLYQPLSTGRKYSGNHCRTQNHAVKVDSGYGKCALENTEIRSVKAVNSKDQNLDRLFFQPVPVYSG